MKQSVKSSNPCLYGRQACTSPPDWGNRADVIPTFYDIVKAHGAELKVETKEGEGCTLIIQLPI